ncbi:MAG TPA: hypothetical protein VHY08_00975 [Bacillota bacterium]|nr:hypothetical protein [Bacillota bacterium]
MKKGLVLFTLIVLLIIFSAPAMAFEIVSTENTLVKYGVGFEMCGFLSTGVSGTFNISEQFAAQGIIGTPSEFISFSGVKLMYRFAKGEGQNYFLFGTGGALSGSTTYMGTKDTGTGWAVGIGMEYSPDIFPDNLRYSTEIGYAETTLADFPTFLYYNFGFRIYF